MLALPTQQQVIDLGEQVFWDGVEESFMAGTYEEREEILKIMRRMVAEQGGETDADISGEPDH